MSVYLQRLARHAAKSDLEASPGRKRSYFGRGYGCIGAEAREVGHCHALSFVVSFPPLPAKPCEGTGEVHGRVVAHYSI